MARIIVHISHILGQGTRAVFVTRPSIVSIVNYDPVKLPNPNGNESCVVSFCFFFIEIQWKGIYL